MRKFMNGNSPASPGENTYGITTIGIREVRYPITVLDRRNGTQETVADIEMNVAGPDPSIAGLETMMLEILVRHREIMDVEKLPQMLDELLAGSGARAARIQFSFPYFIAKQAPVTGAQASIDYACRIFGEASPEVRLGIEVAVPISILSPESIRTTQDGSVNQRCIVKVSLGYERIVWIEDVIRIIEDAASCELYSLLKRPDERHVTLKAYDNPMSHVDVVRDIAGRLAGDPNVLWFNVDSESFESTRSFNNFAQIAWKRPGFLK
jgi:GTP cyclohydrolase IB